MEPKQVANLLSLRAMQMTGPGPEAVMFITEEQSHYADGKGDVFFHEPLFLSGVFITLGSGETHLQQYCIYSFLFFFPPASDE